MATNLHGQTSRFHLLYLNWIEFSALWAGRTNFLIDCYRVWLRMIQTTALFYLAYVIIIRVVVDLTLSLFGPNLMVSRKPSSPWLGPLFLLVIAPS